MQRKKNLRGEGGCILKNALLNNINHDETWPVFNEHIHQEKVWDI